MSVGHFHISCPANEPVRGYLPDSAERVSIKEELTRQTGTTVEVPLRIGGKKVTTGDLAPMVIPHNHQHQLGQFHRAGSEQVQQAIAAAQAAKPAWAATPWEHRVSIFQRAASLLEGRYRDVLNAATMLNQSKTVHQAEIDAACEFIDFFRFNAHFLSQLMQEQPLSPSGIWNRVDYRPLDGFVFAVSPFNFTSIAGNLSTAPAMCGNTVVWKPASTSVLSAHYIMDLLEEAGLPPGVINLVPGSGSKVGDPVIADRNLAGIHFTGSTPVFQGLWREIGNRIADYGQYPRVVGETGGKDFIFAHRSADPTALVANMIRGAFEYQGQKCSAASRAYIPSNLWPEVRQGLIDQIATIRMGDVADFRNFMGAVIDAASYSNLKGAIDEAKANLGRSVKEVIGGECDDSKGWFISPTVIVADDPKFRTMCEELFGPVLSIHVYDENAFDENLALCAETSPYALTGAIWANDRSAVVHAMDRLRHAAGNFYINDKPTGAVVGQQPFGGSRASGTNDKAGSLWNLMRWISPRTIKETFDPPRDYRYGFLDAE